MSQLFHPDYPKGFHQDFYHLRIRKLGMIIYDYLFENSIYYTAMKEDVERRLNNGEEVSSQEEWMNGLWMPRLCQLDPSEANSNYIKSKFFSLEGK